MTFLVCPLMLWTTLCWLLYKHIALSRAPPLSLTLHSH